MENVFLHLVNMSITASWIVLAVVILRLLLKKAPKWITCLLWVFVGIRLILPFSIESILSLIPSAETIPPEIVYAQTPQINSGVEVFNSAVNPVISDTLSPEAGASVNPIEIITAVATVLWVAGMAGMVTYALISYLRIRRRVRVSMPVEENIYICDDIDTPFILGFFKPRIYLPSAINKEDAEYVIAHEKAHLKRKDHLWKPIGFILLTVYWFNPVLWLAYVLLCRDIELACDEKVIRDMGAETKKEYSTALLSCSVPRRMISACPLAFGEVGVKQRIKNVLNYKKPAFWISIVAVIVCIAVAVCFLTNPIDDNPYGVKVVDSGSDIEGVSLELVELELEEDADNNAYVEIKWNNENSESYTCGEEFYIYKYIDGEWVNIRSGDYTFYTIGYSIPKNGSFTHKYGLWNIEIDEPGTYRFESTYLRDKGDTSPTEYSAWIDFEVTEIPDLEENGFNTTSSGSDREGISAKIVDLNLTASKPYIEVMWINDNDYDFTCGEEFYIYKLTKGEWHDCREGEYFYHDIGYIVPAQGTFTHKYSLKNIDMSAAGTYRFESHFSSKNERVWVEFQYPVTSSNTSANNYESFETQDVAQFYCYEAEETFQPQITLYRRQRTFSFTLSGLSSYLPTGKYTTKGNILTLSADDGNTYVFEVVDSDNLVFIAEQSAELPKYRYALDEEARYPFEDGARFEREVEADDTSTLLQSTTTKYSGQKLPYTYDEIIKMIIEAFPWERGDGSAAIPDLAESSYMYRRHSDLSEIGYALVDLDNNGQQELIISAIDSTFVYDLYTISDGETVHLFSSGERYYHILYENGYVELGWSSGAALSGHDFFKLADGKLDFLQRVTLDAYYAEEAGIIDELTDAGNDNTFFRSSSEDKKDYVHISDAEALEIIDFYQDSAKRVEIEYTPLSEYNN